MSDLGFAGNCRGVSTNLHMAIKNGDEVMDDDIRKNNINSKDEDGMLPIHIACTIGTSAIVKKLLNHGASINSGTQSKFKPLHLAAEKGHDEVIELLLREGADINANGNDRKDTPLHLAVKAGLLKTVEQLLSKGASVSITNLSDQTVLHLAAQMEFVEIVEILLNYNASVHAKGLYGSTPLHLSDNVKISKMLLDKGADVNAKNDVWKETPLYRRKNSEAIKLLLEYGVDVNSVNIHGETALFGCTDESIVKMMLEKGANVNVRNYNGRTVLREFVWRGCVKIVELLLDYQADVTIKDRDGFTPLHVSRQEAISRMLIRKGANVNAKTKTGIRPIHWAAEEECPGHVKVLLEYGVDVNCKDSNGATPLHYAASTGYYDFAEIILNNGAYASVNDKKNNGTTPLHTAIRCGQPDIISLLLQYDATVDDQVVIETAKLRKSDHSDSDSDCDSHSDSMPDADLEDMPAAKQTINIIEKHFITLKALEPDRESLNLPWMDFNAEENRRYYDSCKNQADLMKHEKIGDTRVSFRDILTKSIRQVATYASNTSIVEAIESGEYNEKYPDYSKRIETKFKLAQNLEFLLEASARSLRLLISYNLPDVVIEGILSYLRYHHLRMLAKVSHNATNEKSELTKK